MPKARCVAKGYTKIEGLDYQEAFAPVVNEVTSRIVFGIGLKRQYSTKVYDVDAAFLNGDLEEEIYLELPKGFNEPEGTIVRLNKSMYGLVQAARMWMKAKAQVMKKFGFKRIKTDPCLYTKELKDGELIYVLVYVDECIVIGPPKESDVLMENVLKIKKLGELQRYNGNDYTINMKTGQLQMNQKKLIESMVKEVTIKSTKIPAFPNKNRRKQEKEQP